MDVTIYHNPACGTSRNTLALIRNAGVEPTVIEYLKTPPSKEQLADLIRRAGLSSQRCHSPEGHALFRTRARYDPSLTDDQLLDAMVRDPILINRPFVVTPWGVTLSRPSEKIPSISCLPRRWGLSPKRTVSW